MANKSPKGNEDLQILNDIFMRQIAKRRFFNFKGKNSFLKKGLYNNGRTALEVYSKNGIRMIVATVNIPDFPLKRNEVLIKTWGENEGVLDFLIMNNITSESKGQIRVSAWCTAELVELLKVDF